MFPKTGKTSAMGFDIHTRGAYTTVRMVFEICIKGRVSMSVSVYPCIKTREMHLAFQELSVPGSVQNDLCFFPLFFCHF